MYSRTNIKSANNAETAKLCLSIFLSVGLFFINNLNPNKFSNYCMNLYRSYPIILRTISEVIVAENYILALNSSIADKQQRCTGSKT